MSWEQRGQKESFYGKKTRKFFGCLHKEKKRNFFETSIGVSERRDHKKE